MKTGKLTCVSAAAGLLTLALALRRATPALLPLPDRSLQPQECNLLQRVATNLGVIARTVLRATE